MMYGRTRLFWTALVVALLAVALLAPVAGAAGAGVPSGMTGGGHDDDGHHPGGDHPGGEWCGGGIWEGDGRWGGSGMWGTGSGMSWLSDNPDALTAWTQLRTRQHEALRAWYDAHKADLTSPEAQQALHDLWTAFWSDHKALYEQHGDGAAWTCPSHGMWGGWDIGDATGTHEHDPAHMWGTGHGAGWLMDHPRALGRWLDLRAEQTAHVERWAKRYHTRLKSGAARHAWAAVRAHHRAQDREFFERHHLTATKARMRDASGGWMGLGGMWGGFGW